jgi:pimeloyl-ACP methyl ester carboxylesterase
MKLARILSILSGFVLLTAALIYSFMYFNQESSSLTREVLSKAPGKFVSLRHGLVHYRLQGPDTANLILFIPGGGVSGCEVFEKIIPEFQQKGFRTLTYDLYGRGYSARPSVANSPELFEEQLTQLLDTLQISAPMHIVSTSMGAIVATDFSVHHPEKVEKVVFIDPSLSGQFKTNALLRIPVLSDFLMTVYWYPRAAENQRKEFVSTEVFEMYKERLIYFMDFDGYKHSNYSTWMHMLNQNKLPLLNQVKEGKVLLIYGDKDPYFPDDNVEMIKSFYSSLKTSEISEAGHLPHLEKPEQVFRVIVSFLK